MRVCGCDLFQRKKRGRIEVKAWLPRVGGHVPLMSYGAVLRVRVSKLYVRHGTTE